MKKLIVISILCLFAVACNKPQEAKKLTKKDLENAEVKSSYALGLDLAKNFKKQGVVLKKDAFFQGFEHGNNEGTALLNDEEIKQAMVAFRQQMMKKFQEEKNDKLQINKKAGAAFMEENKKKEGVVTLPNGIQYKEIKKGTGPKPKKTDTVSCHYKGTLINGEEFDSSYKRNEPATFGLNRVIKGWQETIPLMNVGSKWEIVIPSDLAYGDRGNMSIEPGSTLIFEVELLDIAESDNKPEAKIKKPAIKPTARPVKLKAKKQKMVKPIKPKNLKKINLKK